jgi:hypothetical protein
MPQEQQEVTAHIEVLTVERQARPVQIRAIWCFAVQQRDRRPLNLAE